MTKVLIVDDSAFMRIAVRKMIEVYPDIQVVGEAKNGAVGLQMAQELRPDVITMDVEMPEMDGITATREIMASAPCPIIMLSSLTERGAVTTIKALEMGAVDMVIVSESNEVRVREYTTPEGETKLFAWKPGVAIPHEYKLLGDMDVIEFFEEKVKGYGSKLSVVSAETREGLQFAHFGGIGAFLRYNI